MGHASFDVTFGVGGAVRPEIQVLEIRSPKNPNGPVIAVFLVERRERTRAIDKWAGSDASIHLTYREISLNGEKNSAARGEFTGSYHAHVNTVSLTSGSLTGGGVFIDPPSMRGIRLGTYLMNEIVRWAKQWPEATVNTITLLEGQSHDENKERRNRFYEQFKVEFDYTSTERKAGPSFPILVRDLDLAHSWKENITECNLAEFLTDTVYRNKVAESELEHRTRTVKELSTEQRRIQAKPLRWALAQHSRTLFWGSVAVIIASLVWWKHFR